MFAAAVLPGKLSFAGMPSRIPVMSAVISIMTPESIFSLMIPNRSINRLIKKIAI